MPLFIVHCRTRLPSTIAHHDPQFARGTSSHVPGGTRWKLMNSERNGSHVLDGRYALCRRVLRAPQCLLLHLSGHFDRTHLVSASGPKRTSTRKRQMSAFGLKQTSRSLACRYVRFWHKAGRKPINVCFWLDSSRHRSRPALGLGVSQPKFRKQNCSRKNMGRVGMGAARPVILTWSTKR